MRRTLVWRGIDEPRMEIARAELDEGALSATGTMIGVSYELRYELEPGRLRTRIADGPEVDVGLEGTDYFDLNFSPLFNTLPLLDGLEEPTDFVMTFVRVPSLEVERSEQRYEPLGERLVRFSSGDFVAEIEFDEDWFVTRYQWLAERVG
ncbi:MAG: putative glycolipid-binding domain-containing protein [Gaiellaceae bacterium]